MTSSYLPRSTTHIQVLHLAPCDLAFSRLHQQRLTTTKDALNSIHGQSLFATMGVVAPLPTPAWVAYNRALPLTSWGKANGLRRAKYIVAWRQNRQYSVQFRKAKYQSRLQRELILEQKKDRDSEFKYLPLAARPTCSPGSVEPKDVARGGSGELLGADIPLRSNDSHLEKRGASACKSPI